MFYGQSISIRECKFHFPLKYECDRRQIQDVVTRFLIAYNR